jgi:putative Mg2+ transporter-C (MgtC) family protein
MACPIEPYVASDNKGAVLPTGEIQITRGGEFVMQNLFGETGQGLLQLEELTLAFILSALVGLEREIRQKAAGLRTYTLVGVAAALFMLISKYGFMDVLASNRVVVDPSRVAAQIVSGIGFIGGGVIFMRRDIVRGLTTAASVWLTAALGMACGAGLPVLAVATTAGHFVIMFGFPMLIRRLPRSARQPVPIQISYQDGRGLLRAILIACTEKRFAISAVRIERDDRLMDREAMQDLADDEGIEPAAPRRPGIVTLALMVKGKRPVSQLIARLAAIEGVAEVAISEDDPAFE